MTSKLTLPEQWTLVIDIPSRKGQLRHPLPPRPEQVRKLLGSCPRSGRNPEEEHQR